MLKWHDNLIIGKKVKNADNIRRKLDQRKMVPFVHVITVSENKEHLLEIHPAMELAQKPLHDLCPTIIGISSGKDEAIEMVSDILQDVYRETGNFNVEEYLKNR